MTRTRWRIAALGLTVIATLTCVVPPSTAEHHLDGRGPLGSSGDPKAVVSYGFLRNSTASRWTVGIPLCLVQGDTPAILDGSVKATTTVGSPFVFLGAFIRQPVAARGEVLVGGIENFPPQVPGPPGPPLLAEKGFAVAGHCQPRAAVYAELDVGLGRGSGKDGGGWEGVDVGYTVGGRAYVVSLGTYVFLCGSAAPAQYCHQ